MTSTSMDVFDEKGTFDLSFEDFFANADFEVPSLTQLTSIPTQELVKIEQNDGRFMAPFSSDDIKQEQKGAIPKKTRQNNQWAINLWKDWVHYRNQQSTTLIEFGVIPEDISALNNRDLDFCMQRFILEIRRKDKSPYHPNTLTQIVSAIQRYLRQDCSRPDINLFEDDDPTFSDFRKTLDAQMKTLTAKGFGVDKKRCDPVTEDDERKMWESGVFSFHTAEGLSNAVFFYNGKAFAFQGYQEHKNCEADQFEVKQDPDGNRYVKYLPRVSKNVQGGLKHRRIDIEPIIHYEQLENPNCLVKLYDKYLSLIPRKGHLYRKPLDPKHGPPRFSVSCIPNNILSGMYKKFYDEAGINTDGRNISNHSCLVTCCTRLYNSGFTDKAVTSRSKHRSNAVRIYQREQFGILQDISNKLGPPCPTENLQRNKNNETDTSRSFDTKKSMVESPCTAKNSVENTSSIVLSIPECVKSVVICKGEKMVTIDI